MNRSNGDTSSRERTWYLMYTGRTVWSQRKEISEERGQGKEWQETAKYQQTGEASWGMITTKTSYSTSLQKKISETQTRYPVIVTKDDIALSNHNVLLAKVSPCSHEEADTRIFVHARQAAVEGYTTLMIKANYTDVVVIAIHAMPFSAGTWLRENVDCLRTREFIMMDPCPWDCLANRTREDPRDAICPCIHGMRCCVCVPRQEKEVGLANLERLHRSIRHFYQTKQATYSCGWGWYEQTGAVCSGHVWRSSEETCVNDARLDLFARKQRSFDAIPPTHAALKENVKQAAYQAGWVWSQAIISQPEVQSPSDFGWKKCGDRWKIVWTTMPPIATGCQELTKCQCQKLCSGRCSCFRCGLSCTTLCSCVCQV